MPCPFGGFAGHEDDQPPGGPEPEDESFDWPLIPVPERRGKHPTFSGGVMEEAEQLLREIEAVQAGLRKEVEPFGAPPPVRVPATPPVPGPVPAGPRVPHRAAAPVRMPIRASQAMRTAVQEGYRRQYRGLNPADVPVPVTTPPPFRIPRGGREGEGFRPAYAAAVAEEATAGEVASRLRREPVRSRGRISGRRVAIGVGALAVGGGGAAVVHRGGFGGFFFNQARRMRQLQGLPAGR